MTIASDPLMEWRITFGQQYRHEPHPTFGDAHPDGWVAVFAHSEAAARPAALSWLGQWWAFMYAMGDAYRASGLSGNGARTDWAKTYPLGELGRITA